MKKLDLILDELKPNVIVDIATGSGNHLYQCYHKLSTENPRLHGFDPRSFGLIFSSFEKLNKDLNSYKLKEEIRKTSILNNYEYYKIFSHYELKEQPVLESTFNDQFSFEYGTSFEEFQGQLIDIELLLAIRCLDIFDSKKINFFLNFCRSRLAQNGCIFIVVGQYDVNFNKKTMEKIFNQKDTYKTIGYELINGEHYILFQSN